MKWSSDKWISMLAIVASLGTLFTIVYQTSLFRKQQYAAVLPYLELWNSTQSDSYRLILVNNGIGPAFIDGVSVTYRDYTYQLDPAEFVKEVIYPIDSIEKVGHSNIGKGRLIPSGTQLDLVQVTQDVENAKILWSWFSGNDPNRKELPEITIKYSSVYGEKWEIKKYQTSQPRPLEN